LQPIIVSASGPPARAVVVGGLQRTGLHLLEAERERAFDRTAFHGLAREEQRARTGSAVVVDG
jgi:hypothetical protein